MLVLSRKVGENICIDGGIVIKVLETKGQRISVGIEAPIEVSIWRAELDAAKQQRVRSDPVLTRSGEGQPGPLGST